MSKNNKLGDCGICCEALNKSTRKGVTCPCGFSSCMNCCKTYLLGLASEPKCMSCNRGWTPEFIVTHMTRSFYIKELRARMSTILLEREKSLLPSAQPEAERIKRIKKNKKLASELIQERWELKAILADARNEYYSAMTKVDRDEERFQKIRVEYFEYSHAVLDLDLKIDECSTTDERIEPTEKKKFTTRCRTAECRGFLSNQWKCELCEKYTCSACMESVGAHEKKVTHECKKEDKESAELIKKDCKACPSCGVPIYRILGCNNMWCPYCLTGFDWATMKIQTGSIDNPHYFEWKNKNGGMDRRAGDLPCGGLPEGLPPIIITSIGPAYYNVLTSLIQDIAHVSNVLIARFQPTGEDSMRKLRVMYLLGEITEERWKSRLASIEKTNSFRHCVYQVLEMYTTTMVALYQNIDLASSKELKNKKWLIGAGNEIVLLHAYADKRLRKIFSIYKQKTPNLTRTRQLHYILRLHKTKIGGEALKETDIQAYIKSDEYTVNTYWSSNLFGKLPCDEEDSEDDI